MMKELNALHAATMELEAHPVGSTKVPVDLFVTLIDILIEFVEAMESPAPSSSETSRARTPKGERA